jgi:hypothetical protein
VVRGEGATDFVPGGFLPVNLLKFGHTHPLNPGEEVGRIFRRVFLQNFYMRLTVR